MPELENPINNEYLESILNARGKDGKKAVQNMNAKIAMGGDEKAKALQVYNDYISNYGADYNLKTGKSLLVPRNTFTPNESISSSIPDQTQSSTSAFFTGFWNSSVGSIAKGTASLPSLLVDTASYLYGKVTGDTPDLTSLITGKQKPSAVKQGIDEFSDKANKWLDDNIIGYVDPALNKGGFSLDENGKISFDWKIGSGTFGNLLGGVASFLLPAKAAGKLGAFAEVADTMRKASLAEKAGEIGKAASLYQEAAAFAKAGSFQQKAAGFLGGTLAQASSMVDIARERGLMENENDRNAVSALIVTVSPIISMIDMMTGAESGIGKTTNKQLIGESLTEALQKFGKDGITREAFNDSVSAVSKGYLARVVDALKNPGTIAKTFAKDFAMEGGTEALQGGIENAAYQLYDKLYATPGGRPEYGTKLIGDSTYDIPFLGETTLPIDKKSFADILNQGFLGGLAGGMMGPMHLGENDNQTEESIYHWADQQRKNGVSPEQILQNVSKAMDSEPSFGKPSKTQPGKTNGQVTLENVTAIVESISTFDKIGNVTNPSARYQAYTLGVTKKGIDAQVSKYENDLSSIDDQIQSLPPDDVNNRTALEVSKAGLEAKNPEIDILRQQSELIQKTFTNIGMTNAPDNNFEANMESIINPQQKNEDVTINTPTTDKENVAVPSMQDKAVTIADQLRNDETAKNIPLEVTNNNEVVAPANVEQATNTTDVTKTQVPKIKDKKFDSIQEKMNQNKKLTKQEEIDRKLLEEKGNKFKVPVNVESTINLLKDANEQKVTSLLGFLDENVAEQIANRDLEDIIAEHYNIAVADGTNPELVKAVESLIGKQQIQSNENTANTEQSVRGNERQQQTNVDQTNGQSTESTAANENTTSQETGKVRKSRVGFFDPEEVLSNTVADVNENNDTVYNNFYNAEVKDLEDKIKELKSEKSKKGANKKGIQSQIDTYEKTKSDVEANYFNEQMKHFENLTSHIGNLLSEKGIELSDEELQDFVGDFQTTIFERPGTEYYWKKTGQEVLDDLIAELAPQSDEKTSNEITVISDAVNIELQKNKINGRLLNEKQTAELEQEILDNRAPEGRRIFGNGYMDDNKVFHPAQDIRQKLFNYDNPASSKTVNGIDIRIAQGLIKKDTDGNNYGTFLLYADGVIVGEFMSIRDAEKAVNYIEANLIKKIGEEAPQLPPSKPNKTNKDKLFETNAEIGGLFEEFMSAIGSIKNIQDTGGTAKVFEIGIKLVNAFAKAGYYKLADIVTNAINMFGREEAEKALPYIKDAYNAQRGRDKENRAQYDNEDAVDEFKIENNNNQDGTEQIGQTTRDTETIISEAEATNNKARTAKTSRARTKAIESIDESIDEINAKLDEITISREDFKPGENAQMNEQPHYEVEKEIKKEVVKFGKALAQRLGWEADTDKKGKSIFGTTNLAPAGGDGTIILWKPGSKYGVYISIPFEPTEYENWYEKYRLQGSKFGWPGNGDERGSLMWRLTTKNDKYGGMGNQWINISEFNVGTMAKLIERAIKLYTEKDQPLTTIETAKKALGDRLIIGKIDNSNNNNEIYNNDNNTGISNADGENTPNVDAGIPANQVEKTISTEQTENISGRNSRKIGDLSGTTTEGQQNGTGSDGSGDGNNIGTTGTRGSKGTNQQRTSATNKARPSDINARNHVISDEDELISQGEVGKIRANISAIKLAKKLQTENRNATPEEKNILAKFVGWGGLSAVLSEDNFRQKWNENWQKKYAKLHEEITEILTPDEFNTAVNSTTNAHYTDRRVVKSLWSIVERLGFNGGNVLEPSVGSGLFFGLMPENLSNNSNLAAYELDKLTGLIAQKLYPEAKIRVTGYEDSTEKNNSQDLVISNVPFAASAPYDKNNKDISKFNLHNYFIAKGIKQLKPGGLGVFITSSSTLDNNSGSLAFRQWANDEGNSDFIGAFRLPNNMFEGNAGTQVTTDIVIFRKRISDVPTELNQQYRSAVQINTLPNVDGKEIAVNVNEYYKNNPDNMLGTMTLAHLVNKGGLYSGNDQTLVADKSQDTLALLNERIQQLPQNIFGAQASIRQEIVMKNFGDKNGTFVNRDGKIKYVEDDQLTQPEWLNDKITGLDNKKYKKADVINEYINLNNTVKKLLSIEQAADSIPTEIENIRKELNSLYDAFVKKYGNFNNNRRINFIEDDGNYNSVSALENIKKTFSEKDGRLVRSYEISKSQIFAERVNFPVQEPVSAENITDALNVSLSYRNNINLDYISELLNITTEEAKAELLKDGLAFENPNNGLLEEKDEYLSGFVRTKLKQAKDALETNPEFQKNIDALEKVIPKDIPASLIEFKLGSTWIPEKHVLSFVKDVLKVDGSVIYNKTIGRWIVRSWGYNAANSINFGYLKFTGVDLMEKALNLTDPVIYDTYMENGSKKQVKNIEKTAQAQSKMAEVQDAFYNYIKENKSIMDELTPIYNDIYNDFIEKKYSIPSFVHFPNANKNVTLRLHQRKAVSRALRDSVLLAHQVGTGKTYTMITTAMEMRRLGIAKKPMIVVQNATLDQFAHDFIGLYPSANILKPSAKEMDGKNRQRLFNKIAYGDWDAVIIPQSFLDFIPDDEERERSYLQEQIDELNDALGDVSDRGAESQLKTEIKKLEERIDEIGNPKKKGGRKVKDVAKTNLSTTKKFLKQVDRRKDDVLNFENMGVDALFLDEAHAYKKLGFFTKMGNVKGIDTGRSKRALGAYMKIQWIQEKNKGRNVILATGTPITNTMAEVYTMMKFTSPDIISKYNIKSFDEFATTFGTVEPSLEFTAMGNFKVVKRFKSFINVPELLTAFRAKTDVLLTEDVPEFKVNNSIPKLKMQKNEDGTEKPGYTTIILKQTNELKAVMAQFKEILVRFSEMSGNEKRKNRHIPLVVFNRAKQAAIDLRLVDPNASDDPGSKTNAVIKEVVRLYKQSNDYQGTQFIFSDNYQSPDPGGEFLDDEKKVPNPAYGKGRFNLYRDIKSKLIAQGIPEDQIQIVNDFEGDKKQFLFDSVKKGDVRVVLGSTEKMGVGVNAQDKMVGLHHIDAPPRPMDFEQRNGRILRQGNTHAAMEIPVEILTYGVEKTLDATAYQRLAIKQHFINQMMKGNITERSMADVVDEDDPSDYSHGQMMATLSGSQYALIFQIKKMEAQKLRTSKKNHERMVIEYSSIIKSNISRIEALNKNSAEGLIAVENANKIFPTGKMTEITFLDKTYKEKFTEPLQLIADKLTDKLKATGLSREVFIDFKVNGFDFVAFGEWKDISEGGSVMQMGTKIQFYSNDLFNMKYPGNFDNSHFPMYGLNLRTGQGMLASINSGIAKAISGDIGYSGNVFEIPERISSLENDNKVMNEKVNEPFANQDKIDKIEKELADLEEKMKDEVLDENKELKTPSQFAKGDIVIDTLTKTEWIVLSPGGEITESQPDGTPAYLQENNSSFRVQVPATGSDALIYVLKDKNTPDEESKKQSEITGDTGGNAADLNTDVDEYQDGSEDTPRYQRIAKIESAIADSESLIERIQQRIADSNKTGVGKNAAAKKNSNIQAELFSEENVKTGIREKLDKEQIGILNTVLQKVFPNIEFFSDLESYNKAMQDADGGENIDFVTSGFIYKGKLYVNPENSYGSTQIHEVGHLLTSWAYKNAPELYRKMITLAKTASAELKNIVSENNPELEQNTDAFFEEVFTTFLGEQTDEMVQDLLKTKQNQKWYNKLLDSVKELVSIIVKSVKSKLGIDITELNNADIANMNIAELASYIGERLLSGNKISDITSEQIQEIENMRRTAADYSPNISVLTGAQQAKLDMAKSELASGVPIKQILEHTGWWINPNSGDWEYEHTSDDLGGPIDNNIKNIINPAYPQARFQKTAVDVAEINNKKVLKDIQNRLIASSGGNPNIIVNGIRNVFDEYMDVLETAVNVNGHKFLSSKVISAYNDPNVMNELAEYLLGTNEDDLSIDAKILYKTLFSSSKKDSTILNQYAQWIVANNYTTLDMDSGQINQQLTEFDDTSDTSNIVTEMDKLRNNDSGLMSKIFNISINGTKLGSLLPKNMLFKSLWNEKTIAEMLGKPGQAFHDILVKCVDAARTLAMPYRTVGIYFEKALVDKYHNLSIYGNKTTFADVEKITITDSNNKQFDISVGEAISIVASAHTQEQDGYKTDKGNLGVSAVDAKLKIEDYQGKGDIEFTLSQDEFWRIEAMIMDGNYLDGKPKELYNELKEYYNRKDFKDVFGNTDTTRPSFFDAISKVYEIDKAEKLEKSNMYFPIQTYNDKGDLETGNLISASQLADDVSILHARKKEVHDLVIKDAIQSLHEFNEKSANFLEYWIPTRNINTFLNRNQQWMKNNELGYIAENLSEFSKNLNNFDKLEFEANKEIYSKPTKGLLSVFAVSRLSFNMFTALKQFWGFPSAYGLGIIEDKYLNAQITSVMKDTGISYGAFVREFQNYIAGKEVSKLADISHYKEDIARNPYAYDILYRITNPNLYNMNDIISQSLGFDKHSDGKGANYWNKFSQFFQEVGMSQIVQADVATIIGLYKAAEAQVDDIMPGLTQDEKYRETARLASEVMYATQQTNVLSDKTQMQLSHGALTKVMTIFTAQVQKNINTVAQIYLKYAKADNEADKRKYARQFNWSVNTMFVGNAIYMAFVSTLAGMLHGTGGNDDPDSQLATDFKWNFLRELAGYVPGYTGELGSLIVTHYDNKKWSDKFGGVDIYQGVNNTINGVLAITESQFKDDMSAEDRNKMMYRGYNKMLLGLGDVTGTSQSFLRLIKSDETK